MFLLKYVTKYCVNLRCRAYQFDTFVYCNLIAIAVTINTSITSHNYHFFLVFGIIMFVDYWKFDGSNLLPIFTILCIRSIGLIYYSLQICASVLSPHPGNHNFTLLLWPVAFFSDSTYQWYHTVFVFLCWAFIALSIMPSMLSQMAGCLFLITEKYSIVSIFTTPIFISLLMSTLVSMFRYYKQSINEHGIEDNSPISHFPLDIHSEVGLLGHRVVLLKNARGTSISFS